MTPSYDDFSQIFLSFALTFSNKINPTRFWELLSKNKNITLNTIFTNASYPWNYKSMSQNPNLTAEFVLNNFTNDWDWSYICKNIKNIGQIISRLPDAYLDWYSIANNENFTQSDVEVIGDIFWEMRWANIHLSSCSIDFVIKHKNKIISMDNMSKTIPIADIEANIDNIHWNWNCVSRNPTLTHEFIIKYHDKQWNWDALGCNGILTIDLILQLYDKPIRNILMKVGSEYIPINDIEKHKHLDWNWWVISKNKTITTQFVENNICKKWNWDELGYKLDLAFIDKYHTMHPNLLNNIFYNSNITHEFIKKHFGEMKMPSQADIEDDMINAFVDIGIGENFTQYANITLLTEHVSLDDIENNPEFPWRISSIIDNKNFNVEYAKKYSTKFNDYWKEITINQNISMQDIINNPTMNWDYAEILENDCDHYFNLYQNNPDKYEYEML